METITISIEELHGIITEQIINANLAEPGDGDAWECASKVIEQIKALQK